MVALLFAAHICIAEEVKDLWFPVGETMEYKLYWGIIPVGRAELRTFWDTKDGTNVVVIRATARTTAVVAAIYPVEDIIESTIDPDTFLPLKYTQHLREGRHERDDEVVFHHDRGEAVWKKAGREGTKTIAIDKDTRDVLALTYMMRGAGFEVGQKQGFKVLVDDKLYQLDVEGVKREKRKVAGHGKIKCLEVEPKAAFGGIFVRKGKVRLWFSEDDRKVCVRMSAKVPLASIKAVLKKVTGPGDDFWVKEE